jgi:hypothetical protein
MVTVDLAGDLRRQIAAKQVVCFVGAGVSVASAGPGAGVLWTDLIESGARWVHNVHPVLPAGWLDDRLRALGSEDVDDLLAAASQVASKLGAPDGGEYSDWLHRTVGSLQVSDSSLIEALAALKVPLVTTNYDHLLEDVLHREPVSWRNEAAVDRILRGDSDAILHLHGHWSEPASVVLGLWEYAGVVSSEHTQAVLRALGMAKSLLFVGFGAGLRDPNFRQFLRWMRRVSASNPYRHYRLARSSEAAAARRDHDPAERVMVLSYGDAHADLAPFLRSLQPGREDSAPFVVHGEKTSATPVEIGEDGRRGGARRGGDDASRGSDDPRRGGDEARRGSDEARRGSSDQARRGSGDEARRGSSDEARRGSSDQVRRGSDEVPDSAADFAAYDELRNLEHELDQRMVGEFTLLDILKKGAAERADWTKRSARNLMNTLQRCAADLINPEELDDVYWWLIVYGVLRFQGIERWWGRKQYWEHSVDFAEIAVRGKHLLNALSAGGPLAKVG